MFDNPKITLEVYLEPGDHVICWYNHIKTWESPTRITTGPYLYYPYDETLFGIIRNGEFIYDIKTKRV